MQIGADKIKNVTKHGIRNKCAKCDGNLGQAESIVWLCDVKEWHARMYFVCEKCYDKRKKQKTQKKKE